MEYRPSREAKRIAEWLWAELGLMKTDTNIKCAPVEERCGARATMWRIDESWSGPHCLCACCYKRWRRHGVGYLYGPVPSERVALLGCDSMVKR